VLDGSLVEIHTSLDVKRPFSSFLELRIGSHLQEFAMGGPDCAAANARDLGVSQFSEEYQLQGGRVRLGSAIQVDPTTKVRYTIAVATWEGERYSLYTFAYNASTSGELLAVLNRVRVTESPEGLTLTPAQPTSTPVTKVGLFKELPTLGLLHVRPLDRDLVRGLPGWRGRQVVGGELFVDYQASTPKAFLLVGETAFTQVIPDPGCDVERRLPALAAMRVNWTRG
jgi:hypothetical protein